MKFHFLGTTGYHPNEDRHTACMMLPEIGVVFDAGTGFFRVRDLLQTRTLDLFLSHVHLDHSVGLTFMLDVLYETEMDRVTVHCDEAKVATVRDHLYSELLFPVKPDFEFRPLGSAPVPLADGSQLTSFPLTHPGGAHGFRIDWPDRSMAYVTDTTADPEAAYVQHICDVDTLVHECYFPDGWEDRAELTGHSCLTPVAQVARAANAKRVFLVHINPMIQNEPALDLESVRALHEAITISEDRMVIEV